MSRNRMNRWPDKLRIALLAGGVLLLATLAGTLFYGRWRALKLWHDVQRHSGVHVERETDGFTYSQSSGGRTLYTLHAAKAIQHTDSTWTLHDVVITMYGRSVNAAGQGTADRLSGEQFEYDEKQGVARASGDVFMDLEVPASAAAGHRATLALPATAASSGPDSIHVKTRGLVFLRKLGVAATDQLVTFRYHELHGTALGAEFDSGPGDLHLLGEVHADGLLHGTSVHLDAGRADMLHAQDTVTLHAAHAVTTSRAGAPQAGSADVAVLHLHGQHGLGSLDAEGHVVLVQAGLQVRAPKLAAEFAETDLLRSVAMTGGVTLAENDAVRTASGSAAELDLRCDGKGRVQQIAANGAVDLTAVQLDGEGHALPRHIVGPLVIADLQNGELQHLSMPEGGKVSAQSWANATTTGRGSAAKPSGTVVTTVAGDVISAEFIAVAKKAGKRMAGQSASHAEPTSMHAVGHTLLLREGPGGEQRESHADDLQVMFAGGVKDAVSVASAVETGHVRLHSAPAQSNTSGQSNTPAQSNTAGLTSAPEQSSAPGQKGNAAQPLFASSDKATYTGTLGGAALSGHAHLTQGDAQLSAASVNVELSSGDAQAAGGVFATLGGTVGAESASANRATHVMADRASLDHARGLATFYAGSRPVRMWQGGSQVEAAVLVLDDRAKTLTAEPVAGGRVHAIFVSDSSGTHDSSGVHASSGLAADTSSKTHSSSTAATIVDVTSDRLVYSDVERQAHFAGRVKARGTFGTVTAAEGTVFLSPAVSKPTAAAGSSTAGSTVNSYGAMNGQVERLLLAGDVDFAQPGRSATGDRLVYTTADRTAVMTGSAVKPPRAESEQQGIVTGAKLIFRPDDSTIMVEGAAGAAASQKPRTVTHVRQ
jgi:lipopolysaccharide export system protein LptA